MIATVLSGVVFVFGVILLSDVLEGARMAYPHVTAHRFFIFRISN
jgi:hypothetical protein